MGILNLFERDNLPFKKLSKERTEKLFSHPSVRYFFFAERSIPDDYHPLHPVSSLKLSAGDYDTSRFHLMMRMKISEVITDISNNKRIITQEWELIEYIPDPIKRSTGVYHFQAWGKAPCEENDFEDNSHHEGKDMYIDAVYFNDNIVSAMCSNPGFDKEKIRNTIGFEYLSFL